MLSYRSLEEVALTVAEPAGAPPGCEGNSLDLAHGDTGVEVITSIPLGLSIGNVGLDICLVGKDRAESLDLPVWVVSCRLENIFLVIVLIHDILVLVVILAWLDVGHDLRGELLDCACDSFPVLFLDGANESVA